MRPNNRQRSRGGRNGGGGGGGGGHHHKQQHHNPNRPPNRNQIFDSSGPDVRVRGNAHQVFDKYQALAREAASSGDRILAEAYWQYADHYFRMIQTMGGFVQRNNQGWGDGGEEGQPNPQQQQGQGGQPQQANGNGHATASARASREKAVAGAIATIRTKPSPASAASLSCRTDAARRPSDDPAADEQPEVPEFTPASRPARRHAAGSGTRSSRDARRQPPPGVFRLRSRGR